MKEITMKIPAEEFFANLRKIGRSIADATAASEEWRGAECGLNLTWPDGYSAWVGRGVAGSAAVLAHEAMIAQHYGWSKH